MAHYYFAPNNDDPCLSLRDTVAGGFETLGAIELRLLNHHGVFVVGLGPGQAFDMLVRARDEAIDAVGKGVDLAVESIDALAPLARGDNRLACLVELGDHCVEVGELALGEVLDTGLGAVGHREVDPVARH